jgi:ABC-type antimicrobial peptide transport system permease subunit
LPLSSKDKLPEFESLYKDIDTIVNYSNGVYFELANPEEAKRFAKEKTCSFDFFSGADPSKYCQEQGTPFYLSSFGSNSVALNDAKTGFQKFYFRAAMVIALISAIIMMGTVGKVISDSRRETAVFRAIGAKRIDIAQIYILYSLMLGIIVAIFSVGTGYLIANIVNSRSADGLTVDALIAYNSSNLDRTFSVVGFNSKELLGLVGIIILAGLVSAIGPLVSNLKRNPIRDMRDER